MQCNAMAVDDKTGANPKHIPQFNAQKLRDVNTSKVYCACMHTETIACRLIIISDVRYMNALGAIHTKIDLSWIDLRSISVRFEKVFTHLDRSWIDLSSHLSIHIALDLDRSNSLV